MAEIETLISQTERHHSVFEECIRKLKVPVCAAFRGRAGVAPVDFQPGTETLSTADSGEVNGHFPRTAAASHNRVLYGSGPSASPPQGKRVAVLFSGGPAAGGHNVVAGLKAALGRGNRLLGVRAGPKGLIEGKLFEVTDEAVEQILNTGGFDFLGSDRTKIKKEEQFAAVRKTCLDNQLDAVVVVGGDDSNTNAAVLAEYLFQGVHPGGAGVQVIGVPKTIDGDLQIGDLLPISFGFDTATRVYAELAGNILQDTPSSRKYWHFVKLMGRAASHVALEVALQVKPAVALVSEEVAEKRMSLSAVIDGIAQVVVSRARRGVNHGVVVVPEGLIEFIPEMNALIAAIDQEMAVGAAAIEEMKEVDRVAFVPRRLEAPLANLFHSLPAYIQRMLVADRDSHGNLQVSLIPTERLLKDMVATRVAELDPSVKFSPHTHFFGYEGRCGAPTLFDAAYTYNLGLTAASLILAGKTGYMASVRDLESGGRPLAIPLTGLLRLERRHGKDEMVIEKALVKCDSPAFRYFASRRETWAHEDVFCSPGPRQLWGPASAQLPMTVALNRGYASLAFRF
ncbi:MAG TPA: diphosphate--fructose-6-phosphate 1-phosphotransferase [Anaeromyxobacter sp.]|nr:diphosphate--fructose-6-phosphate 1-phosphotransferase [Anaeromyxobacter sp.]